MKKLFIAIVLSLSASAVYAGPGHYHPRPHYHSHSHWVAPLVIGGVLGAVIVRQHQTYPPILYQVPPPPYGYHYVQILDYSCNCNRLVLMPNN